MDRKRLDDILKKIQEIPVKNETARRKQAREETDLSTRSNILNALRDEKWAIYRKEEPEEYQEWNDIKKEMGKTLEELYEDRLKDSSEN